MNTAPYLIIGNSAAAVAGVAGIRAVDTEAPVTLIAREREHTYSRPLISYLLGGKVDDDRMTYRGEDFYAKNAVTPVLGTEVARVHPAAGEVETADGRRMGYDKLLIATGGRPIVPPDLPGVDADGVFTFTTWEDARNIREWIEREGVESAVVIGGGLIGLKSVEALVALGLKTTLVELADRILSATFDQTASDLAQASLQDAGVNVRCGNTVAAIETDGGKVTGATLRDGARIDCKLVIVAIGVRPDTRIVEGTEVETDRGILVDDHMATGVPGIYAAGDVAQARNLLTGRRQCIAILPNAYRQGLIAGACMAGRCRAYEGAFAMNAVDICGLPTISVGRVEPDDEGCEVLKDLDAGAREYRKIVLKDNRIVGAIFVGRIDRAGIVTGLVREKVDVSSFKELLLTEAFGLISLPAEYRKHVVAGQGIEV